MESRRVAWVTGAADQAGGSYTDTDITDRVPMGRFASPGDIANAVTCVYSTAERD